jgi:hypothetical protein
MEEMFRKSPKLWMLAIYFFLVSAFLYMRPSVAFGLEGKIRPFGVGKRESTVFPVWWWMFVFAVISYMVVVWVLDFSL